MLSAQLIFDWTRAHDVCPLEKQLSQGLPSYLAAKQALLEPKGPYAEYTGWIHRFREYGYEPISRIQKIASTIAQHSDVLVVVGVGGSQLGARAVYEALGHHYNAFGSGFSGKPKLLWTGHHLSQEALAELLDVLDVSTPSVLMISKSGETLEPALHFRVLYQYLEKRFGQKEALLRLFVATDSTSGSLHRLAQDVGCELLSLPKDVGGRYSVFTTAGLLPLAVAGVDIANLFDGAEQARLALTQPPSQNYENNPALCYAAVRNVLYQQGYKIEALCTWSPKHSYLGRWWQQLFGESDGKNNTGIFPTSVEFSADLHSLGQYFQSGERLLFATHFKISDEFSYSHNSVTKRIQIPGVPYQDRYACLTGVSLGSIQQNVQNATTLAHADGQVPTLTWELPQLSAWWLGYWMWTQMFACALGGIARGIQPFDQPGVEAYKQNACALLGADQPEKGIALRHRIQNSGGRLVAKSVSYNNGEFK